MGYSLFDWNTKHFLQMKNNMKIKRNALCKVQFELYIKKIIIIKKLIQQLPTYFGVKPTSIFQSNTAATLRFHKKIKVHLRLYIWQLFDLLCEYNIRQGWESSQKGFRSWNRVLHKPELKHNFSLCAIFKKLHHPPIFLGNCKTNIFTLGEKKK